MHRTESAYRVEFAREEDLPGIMELERAGFHADIVEEEAVFRARLRTFPEGFVLLRRREGGAALGYLCAERWRADPGADPAAYALGHDPAPRHAPEGPCLYVASMTLSPSLRGSGLGAHLFSAGLEAIHGASPGVGRELLIVNEDWKGARRIYASAGFVELARFPGFFAAGPAAALGASAGGAGARAVPEGAAPCRRDALLMARDRGR